MMALSARSASVDVRRGDERQAILRMIRARGIDSSGKIKAVAEDDEEFVMSDDSDSDDDGNGNGDGDMVMDGADAALEDGSRPAGSLAAAAAKPVPLTGRGKKEVKDANTAAVGRARARGGARKGKGGKAGKNKGKQLDAALPSMSSYNRIGGTPLLGLDCTYQDARVMLQVAAHKEVFPVVKAVRGNTAAAAAAAFASASSTGVSQQRMGGLRQGLDFTFVGVVTRRALEKALQGREAAFRAAALRWRRRLRQRQDNDRLRFAGSASSNAQGQGVADASLTVGLLANDGLERGVETEVRLVSPRLLSSYLSFVIFFLHIQPLTKQPINQPYVCACAYVCVRACLCV